ncbi:MAG: uroporphyrinogen decarboxylase [Vampirovibrionales bacterium]|nr:uroporphyrinogen decarboxylase [Vampirovibrionales bacterium]
MLNVEADYHQNQMPPKAPLKPLLVRAFSGEPIERPPVWLMRQAGRYMHEYQAVRQKTDFMTLCKTPALAAEVSMQPILAFGMDAVIVFSDILPPAEAMGLALTFGDKGPCFPNALLPDQVASLRIPEPEADLGFMLETLKILRRELSSPEHQDRALIGFAGAPWTLATYMIEGAIASEKGRHLHKTKAWLYNRPSVLHALLEKLALTIGRYLIAQIHAGAQAVQLFDTWAGHLSAREYAEFALPYQRRVISAVRQAHPEIPVIMYARGMRGCLPLLTQSGATVLSLDEFSDLSESRSALDANGFADLALQGNLDPVALWQADPERLTELTKQTLASGGSRRYGFNLGHGVLQYTPRDHVARVVDTAQAFRWQAP